MMRGRRKEAQQDRGPQKGRKSEKSERPSSDLEVDLSQRSRLREASPVAE